MVKIPKSNPLNVLNIGTKILLKDVMDQYMRSLGEVKTFYASKLSSAVESFQNKRPQIVFCEQSFPEGGVLEFIQAIGGLSASADLYFVLASEQTSDDIVALALEMGIDEILVKPFATENIHQIVERYLDKRNLSNTEWIKDLRQARISFEEKRFQEAEELYMAAVKSHSQQPAVLMECAEFFLRRGNAQIALTISEKILLDSPDNARALQTAGMALRKLGKYKDAADKFLRANRISPLNSIRNVELAETYLSMAEEQINFALKSDNENSSLILTKAKFQLLRKEYAQVVNYLDNKNAFLSEAGKKEAEFLVAAGKKFGGIR